MPTVPFITGVYFNASGVHGFIYSGSTFTTLDNPAGTNGTFPEEIAAEALGYDIVGTYVDASSVDHGFVYNG